MLTVAVAVEVVLMHFSGSPVCPRSGILALLGGPASGKVKTLGSEAPVRIRGPGLAWRCNALEAEVQEAKVGGPAGKVRPVNGKAAREAEGSPVYALLRVPTEVVLPAP